MHVKDEEEKRFILWQTSLHYCLYPMPYYTALLHLLVFTKFGFMGIEQIQK